MNDSEKNDSEKFEPKETRKIDTDRQVCSIRFSPDGSYLVGGGYDSEIRRWDLSGEEAKPLNPITGHRGWVQAIDFAPDGKTMFSVDSWGELRAWPTGPAAKDSKWTQPTAHNGWIRDLAVSADGSQVATAGRDRIVRVWSTADGSSIKELPRHEHDVFQVVFHPKSTSLVTADLMGTLREWDLEKGNQIREKTFEKFHYYDRIQDVHGIHVLQFDETGESLICAGGEPTRTTNHLGVPTLHVLTWKTLEPTRTLQFGKDREGYIFDLAQHPDGYYLAVTSGTPGAGQFLLIRPEEDAAFFTYTKMSNCHSVALHPNGKTAIVAATNRNSQGNGAVRDKDGKYLGNSSPLNEFAIA